MAAGGKVPSSEKVSCTVYSALFFCYEFCIIILKLLWIIVQTATVHLSVLSIQFANT